MSGFISRRWVLMAAVWVGVAASVTGASTSNESDRHYLDKWAVHVEGGMDVADRVAAMHGFRNTGQIGSLRDHYHFQHACVSEGPNCIPTDRHSEHHSVRLKTHPHVRFAQQQHKLHRTKRSALSQVPAHVLAEAPSKSTGAMGDDLWLLDNATAVSAYQRFRKQNVVITDPKFKDQWYLEREDGRDMNVRPAWEAGYTGKGVVVTIVDDGIEYTHPDLRDNYDPAASTDINGGDDDPFPNEADPINKHGTRCCGEVASAKNDICSVGVAFNARIGAVRMLDGDVTDAVEAHSLSLAPQHIDIYSNSWGPNDDGRTIEGPAELATKAILDGIKGGRGGKGSIYLFASGNGGMSDNCNCDGYCNSMYTVAIGALTEDDKKPYYTEKCSATMAVTYSSGSGRQRAITTCDLHNGCTSSHSGTSAAAPLAAGILALALEANPMLTWRDVQHLVVHTSVKVDDGDQGWHVNQANHPYHHSFGFGKLDTGALVTAAKTWKTVGERVSEDFDAADSNVAMSSAFAESAITVDAGDTFIRQLEHVQVRVAISGARRGSLEIRVVCPSGTESVLMPKRPRDSSSARLVWTYMTVQCWDESPVGTFKLRFRYDRSPAGGAKLESWGLSLHGTSGFPDDVASPPTAGQVDVEQLKSSVAPSDAPTSSPTGQPTKVTTPQRIETPSPSASEGNGDNEGDDVQEITPTPTTADVVRPTLAPTPPSQVEVTDCDDVACDDGMYRSFTAPVTCPPLRECAVCLPGYSCDGLSGLAKKCFPGYAQQREGQSSCDPCGLGLYSGIHGAVKCASISPGMFGSGGTPETRTQAVPCMPGFFCEGGDAQPVMCPENTSQPARGKAHCNPCSRGSYQPLKGQRGCILLADGATTAASALATAKSLAQDKSVLLGVLAGTVAAVVLLLVVVLIARWVRTPSGYTLHDSRFSIDDLDSDEEVDDDGLGHFGSSHRGVRTVEEPQGGEDLDAIATPTRRAKLAVLSGMKEALGGDDVETDAVTPTLDGIPSPMDTARVHASVIDV